MTGRGSSQATSVDDGAFEVTGVPIGEVRVEVAMDGYATRILEDPITVDASGYHGLEIRLESGAVIHGRVLGVGFDELQSVQVMASSRSGRSIASVNFEGKFRLEHLAEGQWSLVARLGSRTAVATVELEPGQKEAEAELEFGDGHTLVGRVLHDDEPLAGARIELWYEKAASNPGPPRVWTARSRPKT